MNRLTMAACAFALAVGPAPAQDKPTVQLKINLVKDTYAWPYESQGKEFEDRLRDLIQKKGNLPKPPAIQAVLVLTNTSKQKTTIHVGGDPNTVTLTLKGPGVITANSGLAFTTEFRVPRPVELEPGQSHEVPIRQLSDGLRGMARYVYPTGPGEYSLSAKYQLATQDGAKGPLLKSGDVKLKFEDKK